jgi:hypothetical protein
MTNSKSEDNSLSSWESRVNALLDGELDADGAKALKREAADDHALAQMIIEAWQLQQGIESLGIEPAPERLRRKLMRIPAEEGSGSGLGSWVAETGIAVFRNRRGALSFAGATAFAAVLTVSLMVMRPWEPSLTEIEQARVDLKAAFEVLDRVTQRSAEQIDNVVAMEFGQGVADAVSRHLPGAGHRTGMPADIPPGSGVDLQDEPENPENPETSVNMNNLNHSLLEDKS